MFKDKEPSTFEKFINFEDRMLVAATMCMVVGGLLLFGSVAYYQYQNVPVTDPPVIYVALFILFGLTPIPGILAFSSWLIRFIAGTIYFWNNFDDI